MENKLEVTGGPMYTEWSYTAKFSKEGFLESVVYNIHKVDDYWVIIKSNYHSTEPIKVIPINEDRAIRCLDEFVKKDVQEFFNKCEWERSIPF
jgi:hypothetical protein